MRALTLVGRVLSKSPSSPNRNNEALAREGIDTAFWVTTGSPSLAISNNEALAREGIDTSIFSWL